MSNRPAPPVPPGTVADFPGLSVTRENLEKLNRYAEMLADWNSRFNLVSASTLPHVWQRHMFDSAQLFPHIPRGTRNIVDLGSGAGFPGLVLAIMSGLETHLIESTGKKASFLRAVAEALKLNAVVHQERIENIRDFRGDVITARALKPLPELLPLAYPLTQADSVCLFLKGQNADVELTAARKYWTFHVELIPSLSDPSGVVLKLTHLRPAQSHGSRKR